MVSVQTSLQKGILKKHKRAQTHTHKHPTPPHTHTHSPCLVDSLLVVHLLGCWVGLLGCLVVWLFGWVVGLLGCCCCPFLSSFSATLKEDTRAVTGPEGHSWASGRWQIHGPGGGRWPLSLTLERRELLHSALVVARRGNQAPSNQPTSPTPPPPQVSQGLVKAVRGQGVGK